MKKETYTFKRSFATTNVNCPYNNEVTNSSFAPLTTLRSENPRSCLAVKGYSMF